MQLTGTGVFGDPKDRPNAIKVLQQAVATGVDFIDSVALGVLIGVLKRLRAVDGTFALVAPHERLLKVFRMTALDRVFVIRPTLDGALEALQPSA